MLAVVAAALGAVLPPEQAPGAPAASSSPGTAGDGWGTVHVPPAPPSDAARDETPRARSPPPSRPLPDVPPLPPSRPLPPRPADPTTQAPSPPPNRPLPPPPPPASAKPDMPVRPTSPPPPPPPAAAKPKRSLDGERARSPADDRAVSPPVPPKPVPRPMSPERATSPPVPPKPTQAPPPVPDKPLSPPPPVPFKPAAPAASRSATASPEPAVATSPKGGLTKSRSLQSLVGASLSRLRNAVMAPLTRDRGGSGASASLDDLSMPRRGGDDDDDDPAMTAAMRAWDANPRSSRSSSMPTSARAKLLLGRGRFRDRSATDVSESSGAATRALTVAAAIAATSAAASAAAAAAAAAATDGDSSETALRVAFLAAARSARLPPLVADCRRELVQRGLEEEGIFRVPGGHAETQRLLQLYRLGGRVKLGTVGNVNTIASLLKLYLRNLSPPLLPAYLAAQCELAVEPVAASGDPANADVDLLRRSLFALDPVDYATLQHIIDLIERVAQHSAVNRMDVDNLARCIAPSLFPGLGFVAAGVLLHVLVRRRADVLPWAA